MIGQLKCRQLLVMTGVAPALNNFTMVKEEYTLGLQKMLRSVHTVRQRLRQRCRYQLDSIVTSGVVHTSTCGSGYGNSATSK